MASAGESKKGEPAGSEVSRDAPDREEARLLALEVDAIHGLVPETGAPPAVRDATVLAVWAWSPRARLLALGPGVVPPARPDGDPAGHADDEPYAPDRPPRTLERLAVELGGQRASVEGGPSWLFPARLATPAVGPLPVLVPTTAGRAAARDLIRPDNWQPGEWTGLIAGDLGEWAMAVRGREPVSICHTPAAGDLAAEAGIWTRPDHRGRGLARVCVAAWAERVRPTKDVLFYSTTSTNHASKAVARGLGLTPLGAIWTVRREATRPAPPQEG
ncbi:GNAT family N-acetyltransferase [Streptomyces flavofungini]|uniref:GNAT family N-acetyltransferase n=1 Tax=Streptomyces flavofungini TaxID=68200 RepID=UPI0025B21155|nr:GNAT family N-acetyltransferase [Streptomyces flavofungini]WJV44292.1 GNAT family N-acetyltransferase [Streptomyces flavofungini]